MDFADHSFDIVVLADVIEHVRSPKEFLTRVKNLVKPGGTIFLAVPSLDSLSSRLMGRYWMEFKLEHLFYFDRNTMTRLLTDCGFRHITEAPGVKMLSLHYIVSHFRRFPVPFLSPLTTVVTRILPNRLLCRPFRIVASGINVLARAPKEM